MSHNRHCIFPTQCLTTVTAYLPHQTEARAYTPQDLNTSSTQHAHRLMHIQLHVVRLRHNPKNSSSEAQFSTSRVKTSVTFTRHKKPHLEKQQKQTALHTSPSKRGKRLKKAPQQSNKQTAKKGVCARGPDTHPFHHSPSATPEHKRGRPNTPGGGPTALELKRSGNQSRVHHIGKPVSVYVNQQTR